MRLIDLIKENLDKIKKNDDRCIWYNLTQNPHITKYDIFNNKELPWVWPIIYQSGKIDFKFFLDNLKDSDYDWFADDQDIWYDISRWEKTIDIKYVLDHVEHPWNWKGLSQNPIIKPEDLLKYPNLNWDYTRLMYNKSFSVEFILEHDEFKWDYTELSSNPNLTIKHIIDNPNIKWDWEILSQGFSDGGYTKLTYQDVLNNQNLPWIWDDMASISPLTIDIIRKHLLNHSDGTWFWISKNKTIGEKEVSNNLDLKWNMDGLYENPNLSIEFLRKTFPDNKVEDTISSNSRYDLKYVLENPEYPWNWMFLSEQIPVNTILDNPKLQWDLSSVAINRT